MRFALCTNLLIKPMLCPQNTLPSITPPPLPNDLAYPITQREAPMSRDQHAAEDVDDLDEKEDEALAVLLHGEQDGLDVVLEEDAGDVVLVDGLAALRDGVLVGVDPVAAVAVDGGHDGEVVLELVEVVRGRVDGAVEGVDEGGVEGAV